MSSTSTSDYDNCQELCYGSGFRIAGNVPVYPNVGGCPLVYYAHIPQDCRLQRNKTNKKNSPNCFVKAFRWYTQELPSPQAETSCNNVNIGGFAAWLDKKYDEFLNDSKCEQNCLPFSTKQCSFNKSNRMVNRMEDVTKKEKKVSRLKSPWKKKRRFMYEPEKGDIYQKHSFEYLLRPQDISKAASECCQRTSSCNPSDATYKTSKSQITKIKIKSHSTICLSKVRDVLERQINVTNYDEDTCNINSRTSAKETGIVLEHRKVTTEKYDCKSPKKLKGKSVICECRRYDENYKNVSTQYSKSYRINNNETTACCQCSLYKIGKNDASCQHYQTKSPSILMKEVCEHLNYYPSCCRCRPQGSVLCKPHQFYQQYNEINSVASLKQDSRVAKELLAHSVQTSDHSIVFQEDPLVVKILCENK